jgi:hypothetical protein
MSYYKPYRRLKTDVCRQKEALKLHETGRQSLIKLTITMYDKSGTSYTMTIVIGKDEL